MYNPLICAFDTQSVEQAVNWANEFGDKLGYIKLGLEFFCSNGADGIRAVHNASPDTPIFLDLKLHDIPNTVAKSVEACNDLPIAMLTIHLQGGADMIKAAKDVASDDILLLGVSMLTSIHEDSLSSLGIKNDMQTQVNQLIKLGVDNGMHGFVCSPFEVSELSSKYENATFVTPGVRPEGSAKGDQKRIMTPKQAIENGSHFIVVGRPITQSDDPIAVIDSLLY